MKTKLTTRQKEWFDAMPNNKDLKIFITERISIRKDDVIQFTTKDILKINRNRDVIFVEIDIKNTGYIFNQSFASIQSVINNKVTFVIKNDLFGFGSIVSEIEYFRKYQNSAENRKLTVI